MKKNILIFGFGVLTGLFIAYFAFLLGFHNSAMDSRSEKELHKVQQINN